MLCFSSQLRPPSPLPTSQREVGPLLFPSFSSFLSFTHYPRLTLSSRSVYPATYHTSSCLSYKHFKFDIAKKEISIILSSPICFFPNLYHLTLFKPKTQNSSLTLPFHSVFLTTCPHLPTPIYLILLLSKHIFHICPLLSPLHNPGPNHHLLMPRFL